MNGISLCQELLNKGLIIGIMIRVSHIHVTMLIWLRWLELQLCVNILNSNYVVWWLSSLDPSFINLFLLDIKITIFISLVLFQVLL